MTSVKTEATRMSAWWGRYRSIASIVGLAFVVRLAMLLTVGNAYYTSGMAQGELARNLVEGRGFVVNREFAGQHAREQSSQKRLIDVEEMLATVTPNDRAEVIQPFIAYMMPGQGILLAGTYLVTGEYRYLWLQILQVILDSLSVVLLASIGTMLFDRRVGLLAAVLFAVYIPEARLIVTATRDAFMPMIYLSSAYFFVKGWKSQSATDYLWAGCCVAIGAYFRSEILLLPLFVIGLHVVTGRAFRPAIRWAVIATLPAVILLTPWTARNYEVFGRLIPTNSGLWVALWQSFGEYPNDFGAVNNDIVTAQQIRAEGHDVDFSTVEFDELIKPKVLKVLSERPGWVVWTMVRRSARIPFQMHAWGIAATDDIHTGESVYQGGSADISSYWNAMTEQPVQLLIHIAARGVNLLLFTCAAFWLFLHRKEGWKIGVALLAVPAYNILVHAVIGVHARYILPTNTLFLLFLAALILDRFGSRVSKDTSTN